MWEVAQDGYVPDFILRQVDVLQVVVSLQVGNALCVFQVLDWFLKDGLVSTRQVKNREGIR